jgi:urease accessory protein
LNWKAQLRLHYTRQGDRTSAHDLHEGPLRVLQRLYPEGPSICHHVLVHPPGGVVGGDELHVHASLDAGTHALITTPGATRFYRTEGALALQSVRLQLTDGARLEWLPMETIAYSGCQARNELRAELAPQAEMIGWDVLALGLPAAQQPFVEGCFEQQLAVTDAWLDRARVAAHDTLLLQSPLGWAGRSTLATAWFACGQALPSARRQALVDAAREAVAASALAPQAGVTALQPGVVVARVLSHRVEPAMQLLAAVRAAWRLVAWGLDANPPRIWRT